MKLIRIPCSLSWPEDDVTVTGAFVSENDAADTAGPDTVLPEEIFSMAGADTPLAATMNSAERAISRAASSATLTKYENQFSCYHKDGSWDCTESYLMLGNQLHGVSSLPSISELPVVLTG